MVFMTTHIGLGLTPEDGKIIAKHLRKNQALRGQALQLGGVEGGEDRRGHVDKRLHALAERRRARTDRYERHGVAGVAAFGHRLHVAVVGSHNQSHSGSLSEANERGQEEIVCAKHRTRARVVQRVTRDIRLEELEKREVTFAGDAEKMFRRA